MTHKKFTPQNLQEQLRELTDEAEQKKVKLTPEVQAYIQEHLEIVQAKLMKGEPVYENDLAFMGEVRMWIKLPKNVREKYPAIDDQFRKEIKGVTWDDIEAAQKRDIKPIQWVDLLHLAKIADEKESWIHRNFNFPGGCEIKTWSNLWLEGFTKLTSLPEGLSVGEDLNLMRCMGLSSLPEKLTVKKDLFLTGCKNLVVLPDDLKVGKNLYLANCTKLTSLPEGLEIGGDLYLSENLQSQVKKDAERLKNEGKIKGKIYYD